MKYETMKSEVIKGRVEEVARTKFTYASFTAGWTINGTRFAMTAIRQSYNAASAVQVLHYVGGKKVSKKTYQETLEGVSCAA